jgi:hypothetical protein
VTAAGPGYITVEYDDGKGSETLRPRGTGDWSAAIGHRALVTQHGGGEYTTYRIHVATIGVA